MHARIVRHTKTPWSPPRNAPARRRQPLDFGVRSAAIRSVTHGLGEAWRRRAGPDSGAAAQADRQLTQPRSRRGTGPTAGLPIVSGNFRQ